MTRAPECSCGGTLRAARAPRVELEPLFGLRGVLEGPVPALRCDTCGEVTFDGNTIKRMLVALARAVLLQPRILTGEEARFLRKVVLGETQASLAKRMGIHAITIADWERGERSLSKEHDYELRGVALSHLVRTSLTGVQADAGVLAEELSALLAAPRKTAPPRRAKPYVVPASLMPAA